MVNREKFKNDKKNILKIISYILGFCVGIIFAGILVLVYWIRKIPPDERQLYQIEGYGELSEIQKEDIKTLTGNYGFDPSWGLFENIEIENLNMEFTIGEEIEFTDFNNISFGGNSYRVIEICHYEREHYKELNLRPESLRRIGAKGAIEMRCKKKGSDSDYFLIIVNANRDVFFVPPIELRREDNGYIYWVAYYLYSVEEAGV